MASFGDAMQGRGGLLPGNRKTVRAEISRREYPSPSAIAWKGGDETRCFRRSRGKGIHSTEAVWLAKLSWISRREPGVGILSEVFDQSCVPGWGSWNRNVRRIRSSLWSRRKLYGLPTLRWPVQGKTRSFASRSR
jgi:hypothetical protein